MMSIAILSKRMMTIHKMTDPSKYEILQSMASRKKEMEDINKHISTLEEKIKSLREKHEELKSMNFLDAILLKELYNGTD